MYKVICQSIANEEYHLLSFGVQYLKQICQQWFTSSSLLEIFLSFVTASFLDIFSCVQTMILVTIIVL